MTTNQSDDGSQRPSIKNEEAMPDSVRKAAQIEAETREAGTQRPLWLDKFVWQSLWKVFAVVAGSAVILILMFRTQQLIRMLAVAAFFALAMIPGVKYIHQKWGWKRGAAVGVIYGAGILFVALMVLLLIPAIGNFADEISENGPEWAENLNDWGQSTFGRDLIDQSGAEDAADMTGSAISGWADNIAGYVASGVGLVFNAATIAMFAFYFAADTPRIERALLSRMSPHRQQLVGWIWDTAIEQTGGYFYSRMLLMIINGSLFFIVMLLVGLPLVYALPLALFEAFLAEFIPVIGTYIGAAVPILIALAVLGLGPALILLAWIVVYQQVENMLLSPKLSEKTMTLSGGVAFAAALAGGAIAGAMGAFVALPVAALITSLLQNTGKTYDVVYQSQYDSDDDIPDPV